MKNYTVTFIGNKGNRNYRSFKTEKQAIKFYEKCSKQAIVKKYNEKTLQYEIILDIE